MVRDALEKDAEPTVGGSLEHEMGANFFAPTLLSGCTLDMRISHEEIFGPVVAVMKFKDADEALALSNRCVPPLFCPYPGRLSSASQEHGPVHGSEMILRLKRDGRLNMCVNFK